MGKVVAIIGGRGNQIKVKHPYSFDVIHFDTRVKSKVAMRSLETVVKKADVIFLMTNACSHESMYRAKSLSKRYQRPMQYIKSTGDVSGKVIFLAS